MFFAKCQLTFPFFGHCQVTCLFMEPLSFFGRFVQKVLISSLSDSFDHKTTQESNGSCKATNDSQLLRKLFKKKLFHFCKYIQKVYGEQRVLHCPPRCQNVLLIQ